MKKICFVLLSCAVCTGFAGLAQKQMAIHPKEVWPDSDGNHIQAHGGGILKIKKTYYWYGEQRRQGLDSNYRYVSCYASKDLINWAYKGDAFKSTKPDTMLKGKRWVLERPKVFYNSKTKKYVMYMHLDGGISGSKNPFAYDFASVGVAISDKPTGPFTYVKAFRPLGKESRDIGQFIDDDGSAYLIFESRPDKGFYIAKLSEDFLEVEKEVAFIKSPLEGGAIVHYKNLYYAVGSALTGWNPNANKVATAPSLAGPWSEFVDIAPPETKTYGSQSTMFVKVVGKKETTVIFLGDVWKPKTQWDSRYLWMPVEIGDGKLRLPEPKTWTIDVKSGRWKYLGN
ncbi:family 43 glycosylhydrolase [Haliscomenobacter hydrossis]|uniref:Ricin B lectin n=1 Tax=Haliscomenobacter hydrossis (strain ATCC 27775 / DSM 1100 / LMG 10767 / O) TaxID=760192 RepID=F4L7J7_HALH1|nr:family 43 glycosylhydrolase [Haliscomenobacter hydrossis]AEE54177.1 ricin B lectin [Haliscomenobacter hydrossis DSM 1100]